MAWTTSGGALRRAARHVAVLGALLVFATFVIGSSCNTGGGGTIGVTTPGGLQGAGFLGPGDYNGSPVPNPWQTQFGGEAIYIGNVVFLHVPRTAVEPVLPSDMELAVNTSSQQVHPVILIFGRQTETKLVYPIGNPDVGQDYKELILLIPFVQKKNGNALWHNYVARIYLDDIPAMVAGNQYYGLQKELADFSITATAFEVFKSSIGMFRFKPTSTGAAWLDDATATATLRNYATMKQIIAMPILGQLPVTQQYVCSYFEWDLTVAGARVRTLVGTSEFLQKFRTGMDGWLGTVFPNVPDGAWQLEKFRWRMAFPPLVCQF